MSNSDAARHREIVMPALLRHARTIYGGAMRGALDRAGFDDIPANGLYVIGGLAVGAEEVPLANLIRDLRISKQAAGQLVDTLVMRGYLERQVDPADRRRLVVRLTERGAEAATIQDRGPRARAGFVLERHLGMAAEFAFLYRRSGHQAEQPLDPRLCGPDFRIVEIEAQH